MRLAPSTRRRIAIFRAHRRGWWSAVVFAVLFTVCLFAQVVANDRPLVVSFEGHLFFPVFQDLSGDQFGPDFLPTEADYTDPELRAAIRQHGWMIWPLVPFRYDTVIQDLPSPAPTPPSWRNPLGTDDQARDVLARAIYGFRISALFGIALTVLSSALGIAAGAVQGYYGGAIDLFFQRFIEVWSGMPQLYMLIILGSAIVPGFWVLLLFLLAFSWMQLTGVVRAEFLRGRNLDYVRAARALGVRDSRDHGPAHPAERDGVHAELPAFHPERVGNGAGKSGFPGLRPAAGLAVAGRDGGAGQEQPRGTLARVHGLRRARRHPGSAGVHRRGRARCL